MHDPGCPFCRIVLGNAPATVVYQSEGVLGIVPLNPVTVGHVLLMPRRHVEDALEDPATTSLVYGHAAIYGRSLRERDRCLLPGVNLITSAGTAATQTVPHLHVHVVPRREGDGLCLPWTPR